MTAATVSLHRNSAPIARANGALRLLAMQ